MNNRSFDERNSLSKDNKAIINTHAIDKGSLIKRAHGKKFCFKK